MRTNPTDGIIDLAIFVRSEIEDVHSAGRFVEGGENRVNAILHIQIGFLLMAVAQHVEMFRMLYELVIKIEDVSMGVALAQNRYESKNVALDPEAFRIGLNKAFGGQL